MGKIPEKDSLRVRKFYYEDQLCMREIANLLGVSIDAVAYFMRKNGMQRRSFSEINKNQFEKKGASFSEKKKLNGKEDALKLAGTMLYWGEGYQSSSAKNVDFANSKPEMVRLFMKFLRVVCGINESKLRVYLYCYADQNVPEIMRFWSKETGIPQNQFTKPYIRTDFKKEKSGKMRYGLLHIRYYDKKLLLLIQKWIREYICMFLENV